MTYAQPDGYLTIPPTGKGSAVLVLHAWWGLNDTMKAFCTRLAEFGFVAFAPDLYHGKVADNIADAETLCNALDTNQAQAKADIADATMFLNERAGQGDRSLAVIGFSLGCLLCPGPRSRPARSHPFRRHLLRDRGRRLQQLKSSLPRSLCREG